eukprot:TRINITY_DN12233_c0_g1_i1.p1 TRINITY_DN12233_c0_g1~~TRINITY_DN12233_c0_g1_i1.p1  ORF type:complete len:747 (+),score=96.79 TRINITY_DN12233_c0_g1_i1:249-2243(+)
MARVDGISYLLMGGTNRLEGFDVPVASHKMPVVHPTRTIYRFPNVGDVSIMLTFATPSILDDIEALSMPVTYLTFNVSSADGARHDVQLYFDTDAEVTVTKPTANVAWKRLIKDDLGETDSVAMRLGHAKQRPASKSGDSVRIDWGWWMVVAPHGTESALANADMTRSNFMYSGTLGDVEDSPESGRKKWGDFISAAVSVNLGMVQKRTGKSWWVAVALDEIVAIKYYGERLPPLWRRDLPVGDADAVPWALVNNITSRYRELTAACVKQDMKVETMAENAGGREYAALAALVYRQVISSLVLTWRPKTSEIWYFLKESSTNGDLSTIDLWWPASPMLLALQPSLMVPALVPLLEFMANNTPEPWPHLYAAHDLGQYPIADRGAKQETMFVEATSDFMFVVAATVQRMGGDWHSSGFANYWDIVKNWAAYLMYEALPYPKVQRSTTDWQGKLGNSTNLMSKGIVALAAYGYLASLVEPSVLPEVTNAMYRFTEVWMTEAWTGDHAKRQLYDNHSKCIGDKSFSLQYSLFGQELFNLKPFPDEVVSDLLTYLVGKHSNRYGVPLDCTTPFVGGASWMLMMAASGAGASVAEMHPASKRMIHSEFLFANETLQRLPLIDFQHTSTGGPRVYPSQRARPAVGAIYAPLLVSLAKQEQASYPVRFSFE